MSKVTTAEGPLEVLLAEGEGRREGASGQDERHPAGGSAPTGHASAEEGEGTPDPTGGRCHRSVDSGGGAIMRVTMSGLAYFGRVPEERGLDCREVCSPFND